VAPSNAPNEASSSGGVKPTSTSVTNEKREKAWRLGRKVLAPSHVD
jgi:hypothetical protein